MNERRQDRLFAICGIASAVLVHVGLFVGVAGGQAFVNLGSSPAKVAQALANPAGTGVWVGAYLDLLGYGAFPAFAVWATAKLGGGVLGAVACLHREDGTRAAPARRSARVPLPARARNRGGRTRTARRGDARARCGRAAGAQAAAAVPARDSAATMVDLDDQPAAEGCRLLAERRRRSGAVPPARIDRGATASSIGAGIARQVGGVCWRVGFRNSVSPRIQHAISLIHCWIRLISRRNLILAPHTARVARRRRSPAAFLAVCVT
jgi:hypothetical protein